MEYFVGKKYNFYTVMYKALLNYTQSYSFINK